VTEIDQLSLFGEDGEPMSDAEREAIAADFLRQHSDVVMTTGAMQPRPCICTTALLYVDALGAERRCLKCGRAPRTNVPSKGDGETTKEVEQ
jgi:hypothetical protein